MINVGVFDEIFDKISENKSKKEKQKIKTYYPYGTVELKNGDIKEYYPETEIYIDKSNINNFELNMIYNSVNDTVRDLSDERTLKIYVLDTLKFQITNSGIKSLNNKYLSEIGNLDIFTYDVESPKDIKVYKGKNVKVLIKKDGIILESYNVNIGLGNHYQYIINPMSKSTFRLSSIQYNGFLDIKKIKPKTSSNRFIKLETGIDFFLKTPPDTLSYSTRTYNGISLDPCQFGCEKTVLTKIN